MRGWDGSAALAEGPKWTRLNNGSMQAGGVRGGRQSVDGCGTSRRNRDAVRRTAPGVRAAYSFKS